MKPTRFFWLDVALTLVALGATAVLYPRLPEQMPTHWGLSGRADGFTPKPWGPFVLPLIMVAVLAVFAALPALSPKGFTLDPFRRAFDFMATSVIALLFLVTGLSLAAALGTPVPMPQAILSGVGVMLVVIGNFLGKVRRNFYVGIRTPWTLADEEVWARTHRLGGRVFVLVGLGVAACGLLELPVAVLLGLLAVAVVVPVVYSFAISTKVAQP